MSLWFAFANRICATLKRFHISSRYNNIFHVFSMCGAYLRAMHFRPTKRSYRFFQMKFGRVAPRKPGCLEFHFPNPFFFLDIIPFASSPPAEAAAARPVWRCANEPPPQAAPSPRGSALFDCFSGSERLDVNVICVELHACQRDIFCTCAPVMFLSLFQTYFCSYRCPTDLSGKLTPIEIRQLRMMQAQDTWSNTRNRAHAVYSKHDGDVVSSAATVDSLAKSNVSVCNMQVKFI
jgi:hypothetical protein